MCRYDVLLNVSANKVKNRGRERSVVLVVSLSNDRVPLEFTIHVSQDCSLRRHIGLRFCSHMRTQFRRSFCNGAKFGRADLKTTWIVTDRIGFCATVWRNVTS